MTQQPDVVPHTDTDIARTERHAALGHVDRGSSRPPLPVTRKLEVPDIIKVDVDERMDSAAAIEAAGTSGEGMLSRTIRFAMVFASAGVAWWLLPMEAPHVRRLRFRSHCSGKRTRLRRKSGGLRIMLWRNFGASGRTLPRRHFGNVSSLAMLPIGRGGPTSPFWSVSEGQKRCWSGPRNTRIAIRIVSNPHISVPQHWCCNHLSPSVREAL